MNQIIQSMNFRDAFATSLGDISSYQVRSTCRFDTRIDWILLPPTSSFAYRHLKCVCLPSNEGYEVIDTTSSDHQLITAHVILQYIAN
jgi:hypothetical protein